MAEAPPYLTHLRVDIDPDSGRRWLVRFHWARVGGELALAGIGVTSVPYTTQLGDYTSPEEEMILRSEGIQPQKLTQSAVRNLGQAGRADSALKDFRTKVRDQLVPRAQQVFEAESEAMRLVERLSRELDRSAGPPNRGRPPVWTDVHERVAAVAYRVARARGEATTAAVISALENHDPQNAERVTKRVAHLVVRRAKDAGLIPEEES